MAKTKRSGAYNRNRGHRAEQKIVKELKELGFTEVVSSRNESKAMDDNKVDIVDKANKLPVFIQIKHQLATPSYFDIREQSTVPNERFVIIWDKQKKCEKNIITIGSIVMMDKKMFYELIKPYAEEK